MATVALGTHDYDTSNVESYVSPSFTPAAGDLIVVQVYGVGVNAGTDPICFSSDNGQGGDGSFTRIIDDVTDQYLYVANQFADAVSQTITFDMTGSGDPATAVLLAVLLVSGMSNVGAAAIAQTKTGVVTTGNTPSLTFDKAPAPGNPVIGHVGMAINTPALTEPSGFSEYTEGTTATPNSYFESCGKDNNGPTTVTWGSTVANTSGAVIAELQVDTLRPQAVM